MLVAFVNLARAFFLQDFAHDFFAVDPHAEVCHRGAPGNGKRVKRFHLSGLGVAEHLCDPGDRDSIVDRDMHVVLFGFEHAAPSAIGDEQTGGFR